MDLISREDLEVQAILRLAVAEALERKRRLGQYAVLWRDGKPAMIGEDAPNPPPAEITAPSTPRQA